MRVIQDPLSGGYNTGGYGGVPNLAPIGTGGGGAGPPKPPLEPPLPPPLKKI